MTPNASAPTSHDPSEAMSFYSHELPIHKLEALHQASQELMQCILRRDRKSTLQRVARAVHDLLDAESGAVFLVSDGPSARLELAAAYTDLEGDRFDPVMLAITDRPNAGLTGYIASIKQLVNYDYQTLKDHRNKAGLKPKFLASGKCFSLLGVPLVDRKGRLIGVIKVDNKKGRGGVAGENVSFDEADAAIAQLLANQIVVVLEHLRTSETLRGLMEAMHQARHREDILDRILQALLRLLGADRGDFALWSDTQNDLIVASQRGKSKLSVGQVLPDQCIVRSTWMNKLDGCTVVNDVSTRRDYHNTADETKSEIAVRLELDGRRIGVMNAESSKLGWFDEQDVELVQLLAQYSATAVAMVDRQISFRGAVEHIVTSSPDRKTVLREILNSLKDANGFDAGLIYFADHERRKLVCLAGLGCDQLAIRLEDYSYGFDDRAFAASVFREKRGLFSENPVEDPQVNRDGLETFLIYGPIIGLPLIAGDTITGVLVVWSRNGGRPRESDIERLEPFARLAAHHIASSESDRQRSEVLREFRSILIQMQSELSLQRTLQFILRGARAAGFDRVRAFEFNEEHQSFILLEALGMGDLPIAGYEVKLATNRYAQDTVDSALKNPRARKYDRELFGPDPESAGLRKDPDQPWAVVPLVIGGKLVGQIVADNSHSNRDISDESLEYLTLFGALAGQAIANSRTVELLSARSLPLLYSYVGVEDPPSTIIRRLLVYLTAQEALGFSRAAFLECQPHSGELVYHSGLGSLSGERHAVVTRVAREKGIRKLLEGAAAFRDPELEQALEGFTCAALEAGVPITPTSASAQVYQAGSAPAGHPLEELASRLRASHLVIVGIYTGERLRGTFVVDRKWQKSAIGAADVAVLETFAQQAGQILKQHDLQRSVLLSRDLAALGFVTKGLAHELRHPIGVVQRDSYTMQRALERGDQNLLRECAAAIQESIQKISMTIRAVETLVSSEPGRSTILLDEFLRDLETLSRQRAADHGIRLVVRVAPDLPSVEANRSKLSQALINLVSNALAAFADQPCPDATIELIARLEDRWIALEVRDNGPGMAPEVLETVQLKGSVLSTHKGLGFGLEIVRSCADAHEGLFKLQSAEGKGTTATLRLPL